MIAAEIADGHLADINTHSHRVVRIVVFKNESCFDASVLTLIRPGPADPLERALIVGFTYDGRSESVWTFENKPVT